MASSLLNGERIVVLLFVARILFSAPTSLLPECISLSLLSVFSLFAEISADSSAHIFSRFKIRPGASSGIVLGAVTLPAVMVSKLIQLSRGLQLDKVGVEEFEYQKLLYWTAFVSCFSVLLWLSLMIRNPSSKLPLLRGSWIIVTAISVIYVLKGLIWTVNFLWMVGHIVATIRLIEHVFHVFSSCASIGEALLVTTGVVMYAGDMLRLTIMKVFPLVIYLIPGKLSLLGSLSLMGVLPFNAILGCWKVATVDFCFGVERNEISTIVQGVLLGLLVFPLFFKLTLKAMDILRSSGLYATDMCHDIGRSVIFFGSLAFNMAVIISFWVQYVQDLQVHPLLWVLIFVFSESHKRLTLCIYWVTVIFVSVRRFYHISKNSKIERILLRKYYHLMAVLMFVPALIFQPEFLQLAFGAALAVFLIVEIIRIWRIWPLGNFIHQFMNAFTDHRDSDLLIVSHFSLLLGCALPMWMSSGLNDRPLAPFAGILSLGIGDTMASMVGHKYGVLRWSKSGKKTIEGTAAGITSVLVACFVLLPLLASTGYIATQNWSSLLFAASLTGLLEAYTAQLDNAFIPLVFYSLLCL